MKSYKLKHWVIVTETGAAVMAKVLRAGTVLNETKNFYHVQPDVVTSKVVFNKADIENNPDLFELMPEEKGASL